MTRVAHIMYFEYLLKKNFSCKPTKNIGKKLNICQDSTTGYRTTLPNKYTMQTTIKIRQLLSDPAPAFVHAVHNF